MTGGSKGDKEGSSLSNLQVAIDSKIKADVSNECKENNGIMKLAFSVKNNNLFLRRLWINTYLPATSPPAGGGGAAGHVPLHRRDDGQGPLPHRHAGHPQGDAHRAHTQLTPAACRTTSGGSGPRWRRRPPMWNSSKRPR